MPDAGGNIKGISLSGKAGEAWDRIFGEKEPKRDMMDVFRDDDAMRVFGVERTRHDPGCALSDSDCVTHRRAFPECGCLDECSIDTP